jgi:NADPH:quinone reductase
MQAIGYQQPGSIDRDQSLVNIELPAPTPTGQDLLVEVKAVSVNPVDTKVRKTAQPDPGNWKVLGWDAAGVVRATGP